MRNRPDERTVADRALESRYYCELNLTYERREFGARDRVGNDETR